MYGMPKQCNNMNTHTFTNYIKLPKGEKGKTFCHVHSTSGSSVYLQHTDKLYFWYGIQDDDE